MIRRTAALGLVATLAAPDVWDDLGSVESCDAGDATCEMKSVLLQKAARLAQRKLQSLAQDNSLLQLPSERHLERPRVSLADSAANEKVRAKLTIERDLSKLDAHHYRSYDEGDSCFKNAEDAFDHFVESSEVAKELTDDERRFFKERFLDELDYDCKHNADILANWNEDVRRAVEHEKPAFPKSLADSLNSAGLAYVTEVRPWMLHESQLTFGERLGKRGSEDEKAGIFAQTAAASSSNSSGSTSSVPHTFDSRTKWPGCGEVIGRIHDQGICGSCWAFAALSAVDSRLCISTDGAFSGPQAQLSRGFVSSCARRNGCKGGLPRHAYQALAAQGVPTGGEEGCSPYFGTGEGTDHFVEDQEAPPCPTQCQNSYQRTVHHDSFKIPGLARFEEIWPTNARGNLRAKENLMTGGPMSFGIYANQPFIGYSSGVFDSGCGNSPNHEVVAIGWGAEHWIGTNSWGPDWGENGSFKVADCIVTDWTIPGDVDGIAGFPLPLPGQDGAATPPDTLLSDYDDFASSEPQPKPAPAWTVKGDCVKDAEGCVTSANFPKPYGNKEKCRISKDIGRLHVVEFYTERGYDKLKVNGLRYSGTRSPNGILPTSDIVWYSDKSLTATGWKICETQVASDKKPFADDCYDY
eukprot:TRINITY_DN1794_c0_g2_i1.p1 TRINITY_DN1794_c0_g2~~TRINITY_DN1794_c0_g2_i1.p1  ORF type:complete len:638 (+),score=123.19 TRINITY_DN1794_c0_g2_i1:107-2020(+)